LLFRRVVPKKIGVSVVVENDLEAVRPGSFTPMNDPFFKMVNVGQVDPLFAFEGKAGPYRRNAILAVFYQTTQQRER